MTFKRIPLNSPNLDRLPMSQSFRDQLGTFLVVLSVEDDHVLSIRAQVDTSRPPVHSRVRVRMCCEIPGRTVGRLQTDFAGAVQLRCVRLQRPFSLPVVENSRRIFPVLSSLA